MLIIFTTIFNSFFPPRISCIAVDIMWFIWYYSWWSMQKDPLSMKKIENFVILKTKKKFPSSKYQSVFGPSRNRWIKSKRIYYTFVVLCQTFGLLMVVAILSVFILVRTLNLPIAFGLAEQIRNKKPFLSGVAAISLLIKVSA